MNKRVLLPTDFSKNSWNAISYAIELFDKEACDFYVLHAYTPSTQITENLMASQLGLPQLDELKEASAAGLKKLSRQLAFRDESTQHRFHYISEYSFLTEAIANVCRDKDIDLVIMGTKGATDAIDVLLGGNTLAVMEKIRCCPVLAIPKSAIFGRMEEIVFPTSFREGYKKQQMQHLTTMAHLCKAPIRVLHISDEPLDSDQKNQKKLLTTMLQGVEYSFHLLENVDIPTGLNCFVQSRDSSMVAFINPKHGIFSNWFRRPLARELNYHSKVPVLTLHTES
ncbi:universal stress protein [Gilvibacter sp.]|uniref:universal stress protein n=1 Tax=Gilvibacter sp. TaxID=2729997 RepID=UPI0035BEA239